MTTERGTWRALATISLLAAPLLTGCAHDGTHVAPASSFGEANRQTMLAQIVEPDNAYDTVVAPSSAGKAAQAVDRYRRDTVKKPERVRSTTTSSSSTTTN